MVTLIVPRVDLQSLHTDDRTTAVEQGCSCSADLKATEPLSYAFHSRANPVYIYIFHVLDMLSEYVPAGDVK